MTNWSLWSSVCCLNVTPGEMINTNIWQIPTRNTDTLWLDWRAGWQEVHHCQSVEDNLPDINHDLNIPPPPITILLTSLCQLVLSGLRPRAVPGLLQAQQQPRHVSLSGGDRALQGGDKQSVRRDHQGCQLGKGSPETFQISVIKQKIPVFHVWRIDSW